MKIIYDKRSGAILYTIENQVEDIELPDFHGEIDYEEKFNVFNYYVDLSILALTEKNYITLIFDNGLLKIQSTLIQDYSIELLIENADGFKPIPLDLIKGYKEISINNQSKLYTKISVFDGKNYSNILELNKTETDVTNGINI